MEQNDLKFVFPQNSLTDTTGNPITKTTTSAVDNKPPAMTKVHVDNGSGKIYVYFDEALNTGALPDKSDFTHTWVKLVHKQLRRFNRIQIWFKQDSGNHIISWLGRR